ncbi:hypothetical protein [uncultured Algibacter sp.]|uniref:hypothetical protein n=1 Tax=uncultured Algibacter sp. TaxID=298659 RepID=UPI0026147980|nr:hypothetical protein [uncultured Algibacter sp.]
MKAIKKNNIVHTKLIYLLLASFLIVFLGCSNTDDINDNEKPKQKDNTGVYVTGGTFKNNISIAKYWENGVTYAISDSTSTATTRSLAETNSIFVYEGIIYIAGTEGNGSTSVAKYWTVENGKTEEHILTKDVMKWAMANSIFVSNNVVHVVGYETNAFTYGNKTKYWTINKGGEAVEHNIFDDNIWQNPTSIFVSNGDVYISVFHEEADKGIGEAKYLKNGVSYDITDGTKRAVPNSIFKSNGIVYVAGKEKNGITNTDIAKYWTIENGNPPVEHVLINDDNNSDANSIFISNNIIYIAGYESNGTVRIAKYWTIENGEKKEYSLSKGESHANANSIFVFNDIIYVAGEEYNGTVRVAKYWTIEKGNTPVEHILSNDSYASSIFFSK